MGYYTGSAGEQAFVASQINGAWGEAEEIHGLAALNTGYFVQVTSVSCASAGTCSAAGFYTGSAGIEQAFVVSQINGAWGEAEEIHGPAA